MPRKKRNEPYNDIETFCRPVDAVFSYWSYELDMMSKLSQFGKTEVIGLNTKSKKSSIWQGFSMLCMICISWFFLFWISGWCTCMIEYLSCFKTNICLNWRFLSRSFELVFQQSVECPPWQMLAIGLGPAPRLICIQRLHLDSAPEYYH